MAISRKGRLTCIHGQNTRPHGLRAAPAYPPAVAHRQSPQKRQFTAKINSVHVFTRNKSGRVNTQTVKNIKGGKEKWQVKD